MPPPSPKPKPKVSRRTRYTCIICGEPKLATLFPRDDAYQCSDCLAKKAADAENEALLAEPLPPAPEGYKFPSLHVVATPTLPTLPTLPTSPQGLESAPGVLFQSPGLNPDVAAEMIDRTLARRKLLSFIKRFKPKYLAGWVHKDICRRLERFVEQVEQGLEPRLLLTLPVRHGKSEIGSRHFAPWVLGKHPDWEIIAASGAQSLALSFSRYIRDLVRDPSYQAVYPDMHLDPGSQSIENWNTTRGGGYLAAGVGTMITGRGAHCLPLSQQVITDKGVKTLGSMLNDKETSYSVLSYEGKNLTFRKINAFITRTSDHFYRIQTSAGVFEATGEHPVCCAFSEAGPVYRRVDDVRVGEKLVVVGTSATEPSSPAHYEVPSLRSVVHTQPVKAARAAASVRSPEPYVLSELYGGCTKLAAAGCARLYRVWSWLHSGFGRTRAACSAWRQESFLFLRMHGQVSLAGVCGRESSQLFSAGSDLHSVFKGVSTKQVRCFDGSHAEAVLQQGLLRCLVDWSPYPRGYRSKFAEVLPSRVQEDAQTNDGVRGEVRSMRGSCEGLASQRRQNREQRSEKLGTCVSELPQPAPQREGTKYSQIIAIERVEESLVVCDIEVEGSHNFVLPTGNLLLNCLILDDVVKDAESSDSVVIRDSIWEWYLSTAQTRLAPGGGVLAIMTTWNEDDWSGRIQQVMATGEGDKFEIVKYPAINDRGDEYMLPDESIEQFPEGTRPPVGSTLTRPMNTALHPERYTLEMLLRRKANYYALGQQRWWTALYQQNPSPEEGVFFTKDMFVEYTHAPQRTGRVVYQAWDFAITEKQKSDYTVATTGLVDEYDNLYILDVWRFKTDDGTELGTAIMSYAKTWDVSCVAVEDGQIWKAIKSNFDKACESARYYPSYEVFVPLTDKRTRAQPARGRMQQKKVQFPVHAPWYAEFKSELLRFQSGGKHDDCVDSLAMLVRLATAHASPKGPPKPKNPKSWKQQLRLYTQGVGAGHMAA